MTAPGEPPTTAERGTIVYVHGASDRHDGVKDHVDRIERSLAKRSGNVSVVVANWGDVAGPTLAEVCRSLPGTVVAEAPCIKPPVPGRWNKLRYGVAGAVVAAQFFRRSRYNWVKLRATDTLLELRDDLMYRILGVADALVYQRTGGPIRDVVRAALESVPDENRPLVAVGNSLGGIILFDLLRQPDAPRPDLFVTVGSQPPVMQTLGALDPGNPKPFQPWLNIYDRRDFFAFLAEPVWPTEPGIKDHRVNLEKGFPEVHGPEYFSHVPVFDAIFAHPAVVGYSEGHGGG